MNANAEDSVVQQMRVFNLTGNFTAVLAGVSSARSITHKLDLGCHARTFAFGAVTGTTKASAYWPWYKLVKDGGRWDFKDKILIELDDAIRLTDTFHSRWYEYSTPGNIHYAYVGRAAGFSGLELHAGATFAQQTDPENIPEENDWHGDQPTDYSAIEFGIHLWKTCQHPLTQACFKSILLQYSSKLEPADPPLVPYYNEEYGTNFPIDYFNGGEK